MLTTLTKLSTLVQTRVRRRNHHSTRGRKPALVPKIWLEARRLFLMMIGVAIAAFGYSLFQVPHNIAAGGITGLAIFVNYFSGWPVGVMYLLMNIPLLILGYFYLGRWSFILRTTLAVFLFSTTTDLLLAYWPTVLLDYPLTNDTLLNAVYAGLIGGIGGGIVYRAGSTMGGTGIIGRVIQQKTGVPLSQIYLFTDGVIVLTAGIIFGWELALYALLALFLNGLATDYALEGPSSVRTATIVTNQPEAMAQALMAGLGRGVTHWPVSGGYTGQPHGMLLCTVYRPQVNDLKRIVAEVDPAAFVTIGVAHQALGSGFLPLKQSL